MYCYFCGKENNEGNKFCKHCGNSLHPDGNKTEIKDIYKNNESLVVGERIKETGYSRKLLAVAGVLALLVLAGIGAIAVVCLNSRKPEVGEQKAIDNSDLQSESVTDNSSIAMENPQADYKKQSKEIPHESEQNAVNNDNENKESVLEDNIQVDIFPDELTDKQKKDFTTLFSAIYPWRFTEPDEANIEGFFLDLHIYGNNHDGLPITIEQGTAPTPVELTYESKKKGEDSVYIRCRTEDMKAFLS